MPSGVSYRVLLVKLKQHKKLVYFSILGFAIRFALAPFTGHPQDVSVMYQATIGIVHGGNPATVNLANIPMVFYTLVPISYLYILLAPLFHVTSTPISSSPSIVQSAASWAVTPTQSGIVVSDWLYNVLLKVPFIASDFVIGCILYKFVLQYRGSKTATAAFAVWFLNPMVIWVSSVWGMFDSLPVLFTLLATYFVIRKRYSLSALALALAIGYKLYPIFLVIPVFLYIHRKEQSFKQLLRPIAVLSATTLTLFLPFLNGLFTSTSYYLVSPIGSPSAEPWQTYGLTYWSAAPFTAISGIETRILSLGLFITLGFIAGLVSAFKIKGNEPQSLIYCELVALSAIFFSYIQVNEQWVLWLIPFMVLLFLPNGIRWLQVLLLSIVSIAYSFINSLIAAFFVPSSRFSMSAFISLVQITSGLTSYRLLAMAVLGTAFSGILAISIITSSQFSQAEKNNLNESAMLLQLETIA